MPKKRRVGRPPGARRKALLALKRTYNSGKPCIRGHTCDRLTRTGECIECHKIRNKINQERYKQNHPDYKEIGRIRQQEYRDKNPEGSRRYMREYMREYRKTKKGQERIKAALEKYYASEKGQKMAEKVKDKAKRQRIEDKQEMWIQEQLDLENDNGIH